MAATEGEDGIPIPRQIKHTQTLIEAKRGGRGGGGGRGGRGGPPPGGRGGGIAKRGGRRGAPARGAGRGGNRGGASGGAKVMIEPHRHPGTFLQQKLFSRHFEIDVCQECLWPEEKKIY